MRARSPLRFQSVPATFILTTALVTACGGSPPPPAAAPAPPAPAPVAATPEPAPVPPIPAHDQIDRLAFNRVAVHLNLPVYWTSDADGNGVIEPNETASLLFYPTSADAKWVSEGAFTPAFEAAYKNIVAASKETPSGPSADETQRRKLVIQDLDQARPTLVENDLSALSADDKEFVRHVLAASDLVDKLYATQIGAAALASQVPADDLASQSLFRRDWGPTCLQPATEKNPACSAIPHAPKPICDAYPSGMQAQPSFCDTLEKLPNAKALLDPFVVVRDKGGKLEPVPYSEAYKPTMEAIANELKAAAKAVTSPSESALKTYLLAAAQSFLDDNWTPADEAWAKMNATNSAWFLRIAPDEVYWDPCTHKAGFHVTFARINKDSLAWQQKLVPVEQEMEDTLAKHIGKPYAARKVTFHLPDFIDIVINAGDDRKDTGATIGQSLPNWGPVANEGRGRTVAMSNLYADPDSQKARHEQAASLMSADSMGMYEESGQPGLLNTILHEATHNLGPAHEYKHQGKTDAQAFGGGLASMMEELKANSGAYYYVEFLKKKGIIDDTAAKRAYLDNVIWAFGHISRGMYTESGGRKAYSQLAAVQIGFLLDEGALTFDPNATAANGKDNGAFSLHFEKVPAAVDKMMKAVGTLKANANRAGAEALAKKYVDGTVVPQKLITERMVRSPKASFVYGVKL
ncbi:MAG TPA: hypothetical protein VGI39_21095 [Polyangiaceae bacterium]